MRKHTLGKNFLLEGEVCHDRFSRVMRPVDHLLAMWMRAPRSTAPIFIMGPQRSGTTLFYKCLQQHQQLCWFDQSTDYFPDAFISASLYLRAIGATTATDFLARYDLKKDLWIRTWKNHGYAYSEGNRVWKRLGPAGQWRSDEHRAWAKHFYPRMITRLQRYTGKPVFMNKCPANALRISQLTELFPNARFIHVERDPRGVINSIVNIHRALNVRSWGPMPVPEVELQGLTEYERVTRQWIAITDAIRVGLSKLPMEQQCVVRYEDFISAPQERLSAIVTAMGMESFAAPLQMEIRQERAAGWKTEIPAEELARVERMLAQAGYANAMNEA